MRRLQKTTSVVRILAPALLLLAGGELLAGCEVWTSDSTAGGSCYASANPSVGCTNWYDFDDNWHRAHWNDPGWVWCNQPDAGVAPSGGQYGGSAGYDAGTSPSGNGMMSDGASSSGPSQDGGAGAGQSGDGGGAGCTTGCAARDGGNAGTSADGGAADAHLGPACLTSGTCPVGSSCVSGFCQTCSGGVCICQRDGDCSSSQVCDHTTGTCAAPPPTCAQLTTEAACSARADCEPIYGGMSCTNDAGTVCHSGEANCTCATYSFAVCVARTL
jgi:hypothetical protein